MRKHLFFVCPTDFLETVINEAFGRENVYLTSLGNSISFDAEMASSVNGLLEARKIRSISFVLSDDNRIVSDALGKKAFSHMPELDKFYRNIERQRKHCEEVWPTNYHQFLITSFYLNHKIMQLRAQLDEALKAQIHFSAKIYKRQEHVFRDICSFSVSRCSMALN